MELSPGGRWELCWSHQRRKKHVSEIKVILTIWHGERGGKKKLKMKERIKSERKCTQGHFRHRSCDINISFIFFFNEINCFPMTLKVISTSCGFLCWEWQWEATTWVRTWGGIRCLYSLVSLRICSNFRLSQTELFSEFSLAVTSGSN